MKVIKELKGHSGSQVLLIQDPDIRVRKIGNTARNLERYSVFEKLELPCPKIIQQSNDSYDMEYIACLDIKTYLSAHPVRPLSDFLISTITRLGQTNSNKDYTAAYQKKLATVDFTGLVFDRDQLISELPKILPSSDYHGDLTLENILWDIRHNRFVLIDPLTTDYDSYVFDLAKLRQDLSCHWFIRNESTQIKPKLQQLYEDLTVFDFIKNDCTLILMLLRVLAYAQGPDREYLINEANKLWKLSYPARA